jgi:hypothetical protein
VFVEEGDALGRHVESVSDDLLTADGHLCMRDRSAARPAECEFTVVVETIIPVIEKECFRTARDDDRFGPKTNQYW